MNELMNELRSLKTFKEVLDWDSDNWKARHIVALVIMMITGICFVSIIMISLVSWMTFLLGGPNAFSTFVGTENYKMIYEFSFFKFFSFPLALLGGLYYIWKNEKGK